MKKKVAFTICAKNYIGLAQTLEKSIKENQKDVTFLIFVADEFASLDQVASALPDNVIIAKNAIDIPTEQWYQMAFKYDLTEFCTAIKPSCFKYIFKDSEVGSCIYFDPDILIFNTLDTIYDCLNDHSILLTPHTTTIETIYTGSLNERNLLYSGMFNLGFIALKNDSSAKKLLDWWEERLKDRCYQNMMENYFTDQKWIDFLPSFFPSQLLVSSDLGLNMAPWNFYEREILVRNNQFFVKNRITKEEKQYPLTFVHFSGFDYKALLNNEVRQGNIKALTFQEDLMPVFTTYTEKLLQSEMSSFIKLTYTYNYFSNQTNISIIYRRLFRRLLEDGKVDFNPFEVNAQFYKALNSAGLIKQQMVSADKSNIDTVSNIEAKTIKINRLLKVCFKLIGAERFFLLTRLMRLYSKHENHVYLIDKDYFKHFKIWN